MKRVRELQSTEVFLLHKDATNRKRKDLEAEERSSRKHRIWKRNQSLGVEYVEGNVFHLYPDFRKRLDTVFCRVS